MRLTNNLLVAALLMLGCEQKPNRVDLDKLEGYWEISKVELPNGDTKTFEINMVVDHITLIDPQHGIRQKVTQEPTGAMLATEDVETFEIIETAEGITLHYQTEMDEWVEELLSLEDSSLVVINERNLKYIYKRYQPLNIQE